MSSQVSPAVVRSRNPGIDVLRGLCIVLVVVHHVALRIPLRDGVLAAYVPRQLLGALVYNGYAGVFIFFVISGFLIALHSMQRWGSLPAIEVRGFYARRAARILPSLLLIVGVLALMHALAVPDYTIDRAGQSLTGALVAALGLHLNWYEGVTWLLGLVMMRGFTEPCDRRVRRWLLPAAVEGSSDAIKG